MDTIHAAKAIVEQEIFDLAEKRSKVLSEMTELKKKLTADETYLRLLEHMIEGYREVIVGLDKLKENT